MPTQHHCYTGCAVALGGVQEDACSAAPNPTAHEGSSPSVNPNDGLCAARGRYGQGQPCLTARK
jgi:hypothetical protein